MLYRMNNVHKHTNKYYTSYWGGERINYGVRYDFLLRRKAQVVQLVKELSYISNSQG